MPSRIDSIADSLYQARTLARPIPPPSETMALASLDEAYLVQQHNNLRRKEDGDRPVGRKIGLTSRAAQRQFGVDQPDMGLLWQSTRFSSGAEISMQGLLFPKVEAELAFLLDRDIDSLPGSAALLRPMIRAVTPALEIVDSRILDWRVTLADTVADNASGWGVVVGGPELAPDGIDLRQVSMRLLKNDVSASEGNGAAVLGDPLEALFWAAGQAIRLGNPLRAGELILTGAMGPAVVAGAGDRFEARIDGFEPLPVRFAG